MDEEIGLLEEGEKIMLDNKRRWIHIPIEPARAVELLKCVDSTAGKAFKEMIFDIVAKTLEDK
jgi:hypothetical protein